MVTERVHFRLIEMPCCGMLFCCVNPRLPNFCIECGARVYMSLRGIAKANIQISDDSATLRYDEIKIP